MKLRPTHLKMGFDRALTCRVELEVGLGPRAFGDPYLYLIYLRMRERIFHHLTLKFLSL